MSIKPTRWLRLTSPHLKGPDVRRLQEDLNLRLSRAGRGKIDVDADYGQVTQGAVRQVLYDLGALPEDLDNGCTTDFQMIIGDPESRPQPWYDRARERDKKRKEDGEGRDAFVKYLRSYVGKAESPKDSNHAPWLEPIMHEAGWHVPLSQKGPPYCGIGVLVGLRRSGVQVPLNWSYVPNIIKDCKAGAYGFKVVSFANRQPGDVVCFDGFADPGVVGDHTGGVEDKEHTIEFNTSPGAGSGASQQDGGGCWRRTWSERARFAVLVARPPWGK